jgi:hypothetical protein
MLDRLDAVPTGRHVHIDEGEGKWPLSIDRVEQLLEPLRALGRPIRVRK